MKELQIKDIVDPELVAKKLVDLCELSFEYPIHWTKKQFLEDFQSPYAIYFLIFDGEECVAFLNGHALFEEFELFLIAVNPNYKNQGLGTSLMHNLFIELKNRDVNLLFLEVRESNEQAYKFYNKLGFQLFNKRNNYYQNPIETAWLLRKEIG